jgi:hydroxymethylglutaryl-CoA reductase (NADPH)
MTMIPSSILKNLYNRSSLKNTDGGVRFSVKNRLAPATLTRIGRVAVNGEELTPDKVMVSFDSAPPMPLDEVGPVAFPLGSLVSFQALIPELAEGSHEIAFAFETDPFGSLAFDVSDSLRPAEPDPNTIPRDAEVDTTPEIIEARHAFIREKTPLETFEHIDKYSFDPAETHGNLEHFVGVSQIPMGIAGPLLVKGDHAQGEFYVPLATTEGTLVASYNRGMKVLHQSGGVKCAVVGDNMQRAPVFIFEDASDARTFVNWINRQLDEIKAVCSESDPFVRLKYIDYYLANKFAFLRFNFTTGDAAGMNMVGKATFAACNWIMAHFREVPIVRFFLESNFATDKKASMINAMRTRGKRVTAEAVVRRQVLRDVMDADTEQLHYHSQVANIGSTLSGANNNGCHSANAITAMFIATGQDVANVAESSAALLYTELNEDKDLYISVTLPSLIVATVGGGTGLPTQREALGMLGCSGVGKVMKFAEIVAGTVLAGEISLAAAISSLDWVSSHDQYGRNAPTKGAGE